MTETVEKTDARKWNAAAGTAAGIGWSVLIATAIFLGRPLFSVQIPAAAPRTHVPLHEFSAWYWATWFVYAVALVVAPTLLVAAGQKRAGVACLLTVIVVGVGLGVLIFAADYYSAFLPTPD